LHETWRLAASIWAYTTVLGHLDLTSSLRPGLFWEREGRASLRLGLEEREEHWQYKSYYSKEESHFWDRMEYVTCRERVVLSYHSIQIEVVNVTDCEQGAGYFKKWTCSRRTF
jgi:hypothetical protein